MRIAAFPRIATSLIILIIPALVVPASPQTVTGTVDTGTNPGSLAVNPVTNIVYVANEGSGDVTVVDGATNNTTTIPLGGVPDVVAVNPSTNKIYVGNGIDVTVIDGSNNSTTSVAVGNTPSAIAINPVTNTIYVTNRFSNTVTVINGADNSIAATIPVGTNPVAVAINPVTNKIYVANKGSGTVTVINGADNSTTAVSLSGAPQAVAVNPVNNKVYVSSNVNVTILDGSNNNTIATTSGGGGVQSIVVNPVINQVYVTSSRSSYLTLIDGNTNNYTVDAVGTGAMTLAVNTVDNRIYVPLVDSNTVQILNDPKFNSGGSFFSTGAGPVSVAVNPITDKIYVANYFSNNLTVIDGAATNIVPDPLPVSGLGSMAVNPSTNKAYIVTSGNTVTVVDGTTNATSAIPVGNGPTAVTLNPLTNRIYVANYPDNTVSVIDGNTGTVSATVPVRFPFAFDVNPATNEVYVLNGSTNTVTVIDGVTNNTTIVPIDGNPFSIAINPATNRAYISAVTMPLGGRWMYVVDGAAKSVVGTVLGAAGYPVVNQRTNKLYEPGAVYIGGTGYAAVNVIDGNSNNIVASIPLSTTASLYPSSLLAVNTASNKIYAFNGSFLSVVDGFSNSVESGFFDPPGPSSIAVNPTTNKVYVTFVPYGYYDPKFSMIDGITNFFFNSGTPGRTLSGMVVNPISNQVFIEGNDSTLGNSVTVLSEQKRQSIPLKVAISPLPGNTIALPAPASFTFTTSSSYSPIAPLPQNVYYQMDTWQGPWLRATGSAPNFTATLASLTPGVHTIFAYATDAEDGTTINAGTSNADFSNPIVGGISAYMFAVLPQPTQTTVQLTSGPNPSIYGQPLTFSAAVSTNGSIPTGSAAFVDTNITLGVVSLNGSGAAAFTTSLVNAGIRSITAAYLGNTPLGDSVSSPIVQIVSKATTTTAAVTQTYGSNPAVYGSDIQFTTTVTPQFAGTPTGTVTWMNGNTVLGTSVLDGSGKAVFSPLFAVGIYSITAVYAGDSNFLGSDSSAAPYSLTVIKTATNTGLTLNTGGFIFYGQTLSFSVSVFPQYWAGPAATGTVALKDGNTPLQTATLDNLGQATFSIQPANAGAHSYIAFYSGDSNHNASDTTTSPLNINVSPASTVFRVTAPLNPVFFRRDVFITITVAPDPIMNPPAKPTGTVTLSGRFRLIGTANLDGNGQATLNINQLAIGQNNLAVQYSGDSNYQNSGNFPLPALYRSPRPR